MAQTSHLASHFCGNCVAERHVEHRSGTSVSLGLWHLTFAARLWQTGPFELRSGTNVSLGVSLLRQVWQSGMNRRKRLTWRVVVMPGTGHILDQTVRKGGKPMLGVTTANEL